MHTEIGIEISQTIYVAEKIMDNLKTEVINLKELIKQREEQIRKLVCPDKNFTFTKEEYEFLLRVCKIAKRITEINIAPSYIWDGEMPIIESLIEKLQGNSDV